MNLGVESSLDISDLAGKINHHAAGIDDVDLKMVRFEPVSDLVQITVGRAESLAELVRADPGVIVPRIFIVEIVEEFLKILFFLRWAAQLEQHVIEPSIIADAAAVMLGFGLGARIAMQLNEFPLVNILGDQLPGAAAVCGLRASRAGRQAANEDSNCERKIFRLAKHEGSIPGAKIHPGSRIRPSRLWGTSNSQ
jgi:hypothetical protein